MPASFDTPRQCKYCGCRYTPVASNAEDALSYCSTACQQHWTDENDCQHTQQRSLGATSTGVVMIQCCGCGEIDEVRYDK